MNGSQDREKRLPYVCSRSFVEAAPRLRIILAAIVLLSVGAAVFRDFVFGNKVLLYKDIGSDSVNDYFPYFVHLSDYLRANGLPSWSFCVGMGQNLFYVIGYLVLDPVVWLPRAAIPQALVFQHLAKIVVAGLLFGRFLQLRRLDFTACLTGSLLLCFSAYMTVGSCWPVFADEVVCFSFVLFAVEQTLRHGRWIFIPFSVALVSLITVFHLYLCALLLCFYVLARIIESSGWKPLNFFRSSIGIAAAAFMGCGLAAITLLGNAESILNSPRGSGFVANTWPVPELFQSDSFVHSVTAVFRLFSNDILGTGDDFRGAWNYLEAPLAYSGLISLLLFPQLFVGATRRMRILYCCFLCFIILPVVFPWLRYLFWLFHGGYYRAFSLFSILGIIILSMTTFSRYIEGRRLCLWTLGATFLTLLAILYLPNTTIETLVNPAIRNLVAIFLLIYAALLTAGQIARRQRIAAWAVAGLSVVELIHLDRITVSNHPIVTKQELNQPVWYNDETLDAIRNIKSNDNGFFRIRKTWFSGPSSYRGDDGELPQLSLNDAMVFGYYGTPSYSSFNNLNYIKFLMAVDAISPTVAAVETIWSPGLAAHPLLSTFACEKYVLTKNPEPFQAEDYYEFVGRHGEAYTFRNQLFLPFGLTFDQYITEDTFLQLPVWAKELALLQVTVVLTRDAVELSGLSERTVYELQHQLIETSLPAIIKTRRKGAFKMELFRQTNIAGSIRAENDGILVFQTPFDKGWRIFIDGRQAASMVVDVGLLGVRVNEGEHKIELHYCPRTLYAGAVISLLSCGVLAASYKIRPRLSLATHVQ